MNTKVAHNAPLGLGGIVGLGISVSLARGLMRVVEESEDEQAVDFCWEALRCTLGPDIMDRIPDAIPEDELDTYLKGTIRIALDEATEFLTKLNEEVDKVVGPDLDDVLREWKGTLH